MVRRYLACSMVIWASLGVVFASIRHAASCSETDISAALTSSLVMAGDIIQVPACTTTWTSGLDWTSGPADVHLRGAGIDRTVITCNLNADCLDITRSNSWELSGFTFIDGANLSNTRKYIDINNNGVSDWRLHHVELDNSGAGDALNGVHVRVGTGWGLIDHMEMGPNNEWIAFQVDLDNFAGWLASADLEWGTNEGWIYIESSKVDNASSSEAQGFIDGNEAAQVVVRHNRIHNQTILTHGFDSGHEASFLASEVYRNYWTFDDGSNQRMIHTRGGTHTWWGNWVDLLNAAQFNRIAALAYWRGVDGGNATNNWNTNCAPAVNAKMCSNTDIDWSFNGAYDTTILDCSTDSDCDGSGGSCKWQTCSEDRTKLCDDNGDCTGTCNSYLDATGGDSECFMQPGYGPGMVSIPVYQWDNWCINGTADDFLGICGSVTADNWLLQAQGDNIETSDYVENAGARPNYKPYVYPHPRARSEPVMKEIVVGWVGRPDVGYKNQIGPR